MNPWLRRALTFVFVISGIPILWTAGVFYWVNSRFDGSAPTELTDEDLRRLLGKLNAIPRAVQEGEVPEVKLKQVTSMAKVVWAFTLNTKPVDRYVGEAAARAGHLPRPALRAMVEGTPNLDDIRQGIGVDFSAEQAIRWLEAWFDLMDTDRDGNVSFQEFLHASMAGAGIAVAWHSRDGGALDTAEARKQRLTSAEIDAVMFSSLDLGSRGRLDPDTLLRWARVLEVSAALGVLPPDLPHTGFPGPAGLAGPAPLQAEAVVEMWLNEHDGDGDGMLSPAEFRRLLHTGVAAATAAGIASTDGSTRESRAASFAAARNDWHGRGTPVVANGINPRGGESAEWGQAPAPPSTATSGSESGWW